MSENRSVDRVHPGRLASARTVMLNPQCFLEEIAVGSSAFEEVLKLRAAAYERDEAGERDAVDDYSLHFVAQSEQGLLGALRVTCRKHGPLESEAYYPRWLLDEFGDRLCAGSRMCVRPDLAAGSTIPLELTKFGSSSVLPLGIRMNVSKARVKAIPFYLRMGYFFVRESVFDFERWHARCALIALPADPNHSSKIADVFHGVSDPCNLAASPNFERYTTSYREFLTAIQHHEHPKD